jgi:serine/threonine protein kinase
VKPLSDAALDHLRAAVERPDLTGTKYELGPPIGRGGMGTVYRAVDRELGREVALKVLTIAEGGESLAARMQQEARILARLEHPGIVPIHDAGTLADGRVFYAMKLVRGRRLDSGDPALEATADRLRVFQRVLEAIAFAHARGVIHRDLKPENVMIGEFGEVLVLDWGVARVIGDVEADDWSRPGGASLVPPAVPATAHGTVIGTDGFMAPEQQRGDTAAVDERTDIFALGAMLRLLLTGAARGPVARPMRAIWMKAMASDPANRYARVSDLAADIEAFRAGLPVSAYPESFVERASRVARKYQTALLLVAAYLIMRLVLLVVAGI